MSGIVYELEQGGKMNKKLTQTAVLAGICIVLTATGLGFIKTPLLSVTFVHLPVILGVLLVGEREGIILGLIFGLCSLFFNLITPTATSFVFYNPMVSVFPRVMIPVIIILCAKATKNWKKDIRVICCSVVGSLTNTILVLSMIYVFYAARYAEALGVAKDAVLGVLMTTAATNGIGEAIFVSILAVLIVKALKKDLVI